MSGSAVELVVPPLGEVKEVKGFAELFADLLKDNPIAAQFVGGGSNEAAKTSYADQFPRFKDDAVKPGDSWEVPFEIDLPKLGKFKGTGTFSTDDATGTVQFDPVAGKLVAMKTGFSLNGDMTITAGGKTIPLRMEQT